MRSFYWPSPVWPVGTPTFAVSARNVEETTKMTETHSSIPHENWPTFWFSKLEKAASANDQKKVKECISRLRQLGWLVRKAKVST